MKKKYCPSDNIIFFGIDFGIKKIGIAISQNITKKASPLKIIYNKKSTTNWEELDKIIKKWSPKVIVVGQPHARTRNSFIKSLNYFHEELKQKYGGNLEIIRYSEILTTEESKTMHREMRQTHEQINKRSHFDDLSASIILQSWLNENMIS
ncbi:MAG: Holliday junction resolvase RuvX [Pseudomonadota bacterium]|nr:Holliday junction resolvase RuvX [Pseudomonadota bacterium]